MTEKVKSPMRRCADFLFGGFRMTWPRLIIYSVATAFLTAVFLIVPIFDNTSFREMGVTMEAWVLFAIFVMVNCKTPLESAIKTFIFFLISQPLIYLFQVPFYYDGFAIFRYYPYWFYITLATFPAAFVGWFLTKRNWLSLLILSPMIVLLVFMGVGYLKRTVMNFPDHLIATLFCFGQIALYLYVFFDDWKQRLTGAAATVILTLIILFTSGGFSARGQMTLQKTMPLPDEPSISSKAVVEIADSELGDAELVTYAPETVYIRVNMYNYGSTELKITDGVQVYLYTVQKVEIDGYDDIQIELLSKSTAQTNKATPIEATTG